MTRGVTFYFDLVSPYSWLALMRAEGFAREQDLCLTPRPVVYAALLSAHGLLGPVEVPAKRRYTFADVLRSASRLGLRCAGPPEHPFRSLEALRVVCLFQEHPECLRLAARLADAAWGQGRALTDPAVRAEVVTEAGLDAAELERRIADPAIKQALRASTERALTEGVFGVPTFVHAGELFWGHDRLEQLADRLAGRIPHEPERLLSLLARPMGLVRPRG